MKKYFTVLHPFFVAMAPILSLWARNSEDVELRTVATLLAISMVAAAVLMSLFTVLMRNVLRGALMASLFTLLFFLYGHAFNGIDNSDLLHHYWQIHLVVGGLCILILTGAVTALRAKRPWQEISLSLSVASAIMVVFPSCQMLIRAIVKPSLQIAAKSYETAGVSNPTSVPTTFRDNPTKPDVYYIILDGYARADVLKNVYGFDNSDFINSLRKRGFFVAEKSTANYPLTFISLASSLNLNYVDDVVARTKDPTSQKPYYEMIQNPLVGRIFRSAGYRYVHFATGYRGTENSEIADLIFSYRPAWIRGEFRDVLVSTTALRLFEPNVSASHLYEFQTLQKVPAIAGPKFVFVHFLLPHEPYIFDRDGKLRDNIPMGLQFHDKAGNRRGGTDRNGYIEQLLFVNRKIVETIDVLVANSRTRPIILLQSDHGTASLYPGDDPRVPWSKHENFVRERMPNLNAYLVPDITREKLYDSISPVNSFRILCNDLFGTSYERLPDRNYFCWFSNIRPVDVTEIARRGAPKPISVAEQHKAIDLTER